MACRIFLWKPWRMERRSYPSHQPSSSSSSSSQGHFSERLPMPAPDREQLKMELQMELQQVNQQINQQTQMHSMEAASNSLLLQREASAQAGHPGQPGQNQASQQQAKWPAGGNGNTAVSSKQLSLELDQVEREIGKRTREMESQAAHHEAQQYKMKAAENGQPEHKTQREDMGEVSNGSSSLQESAVGGAMLSLTNKTSSLSMCADPGAGPSEMQKNGV
ncbi:hypothetical protein CRUP_017711, partial [Coryphaenoides rupestris]